MFSSALCDLLVSFALQGCRRYSHPYTYNHLLIHQPVLPRGTDQAVQCRLLPPITPPETTQTFCWPINLQTNRMRCQVLKAFFLGAYKPALLPLNFRIEKTSWRRRETSSIKDKPSAVACFFFNIYCFD